MKSIFTLIFVLFLAGVHAQSVREISIIPKPVSLASVGPGSFSMNAQTKIIMNDKALQSSVDFLNAYLQQYFQLSLASSYLPEDNSIHLILDPRLGEKKNAYYFKVDDKRISITGNSPQAVFYGIQTLIQLLPVEKTNISIPYVMIIDFPRFEYRGMHLDVSRHFFDVDFIKKYIDYLALHKMNYFHWHLTDDHGWRIEIKQYPKLTEIGARRTGSIVGLWPGKGNEHIRYELWPDKTRPTTVHITPKNAVIKTDNIPHGGFYTQEQIKEVVDYASKRYITIIPEIEMPAHSMAALAAYPELGTEPQKKYEVATTWGMMNKYNNVLQPTEKTFKFLENVLAEVMNLFPSPYIHIGGDEASKIWWRSSPVAQQIMKEQNLKDENALQSYFIHRIEKFVNSKGKTIIGWDEILDGGLAPNAVVMSWRGEQGGIAAAREKHKVIMTPEDRMYFNHKQFMNEDSLAAQKFLPLTHVYNYDPVPQELTPAESAYIWGGQGNLWSEYITNPVKAEYMLFPRLAALSEILWSPKQNRDYTDFMKRLKIQFKRYDLMGITYSRRYLELN